MTTQAVARTIFSRVTAIDEALTAGSRISLGAALLPLRDCEYTSSAPYLRDVVHLVQVQLLATIQREKKKDDAHNKRRLFRCAVEASRSRSTARQ